MNYILATLVSSIVSLSAANGVETTGSPAMTPAKVIRIATPEYPEFARHYNMGGVVIVEVQVGEDGRAKHVHIVKGENPMFNNAVITAVTNAEYAPATVHNTPVKSWVKIPFTFKNRR